MLQLAEARRHRAIFRSQFKRKYINYLSEVNRPVRHLQAFESCLICLVQPAVKSAFDLLDLKFDLVLGLGELGLKLVGLLLVDLGLQYLLMSLGFFETPLMEVVFLLKSCEELEEGGGLLFNLFDWNHAEALAAAERRSFLAWRSARFVSGILFL